MRVESCRNRRPEDSLVARSKHLDASTTNSPTPMTGKSPTQTLAEAPVAPRTLDAVDVVDIATPEAQDLPSDDGTAGDTQETSKDRRVLRLIAEGHFRGAAAARLRLNFFDQLDHASLPPLPKASGNGRGYEKFRAEYEARLAEANPDTPDVEPPPTEDLPPTDGVETPPVDGTNPPVDGTEVPPEDGTAETPAPSAGVTAGTWLTPTLQTFGRLSLLA